MGSTLNVSGVIADDDEYSKKHLSHRIEAHLSFAFCLKLCCLFLGLCCLFLGLCCGFLGLCCLFYWACPSSPCPLPCLDCKQHTAPPTANIEPVLKCSMLTKHFLQAIIKTYSHIMYKRFAQPLYKVLMQHIYKYSRGFREDSSRWHSCLKIIWFAQNMISITNVSWPPPRRAKYD